MVEGLKRLRDRLGLQAIVEFEGYSHDVRDVWRVNHALVLPSRYEGLPLAIYEAMLCGRPVITTAVAGNPEAVEDGVTGFVAAAATVESMREAMERAWRSVAQWKRMGEAAATAARRVYADDPAVAFAQSVAELGGAGVNQARGW